MDSEKRGLLLVIARLDAVDDRDNNQKSTRTSKNFIPGILTESEVFALRCTKPRSKNGNKLMKYLPEYRQ